MVSAGEVKIGDTVYIKAQVINLAGLFGEKSQLKIGKWIIIVDNSDIFLESAPNPSYDPGRDVFERGQPGHPDNDMGM